MEDKTVFNRKKVVIVSEYNGISVSLVEKFLANFFSVKVVCGKRDLWKKYSPYLFANDYLSIDSLDNNKDLDADFSVFVSCFFDNLFFLKDKEISARELEKLQLFLSIKTKKRKFLILPYQIYDPIGLKLIEIYNSRINLQRDNNLFICCVDEIVGPRMVLSPRGEVSSVLRSCFTDENLFFYSKQSFLKVGTPGDFSREFVKFVLGSKSVKEKKILFSGQKLDRNYFLQVLEDKCGVDTNKFKKTEVSPQKAVFEKEIGIDSLFDGKKLSEVVDWFKKNKEDFFLERGGITNISEEKEKTAVVEKTTAHSLSFKKMFALGKGSLLLFRKLSAGLYKKVGFVKLPFLFKKMVVEKKDKKEGIRKIKVAGKIKFKGVFAILKPALFFAFLIFVFPLFLFAAGVILLYLGYISFKHFNLSQSAFFLKSSERASYVLSENYYGLSKIPVVGGYYLFLGEASSLVYDSAHVFALGISLVKNASSLYEKSLKGQEIDTRDLSKALFLDLNSLYFKTSLLEGKIYDLQKKYTFLNILSAKVDLAKYRKEIIAAKEISLFLPEILGEREEKKYLVLFQNNMELRATGGFIGSFAVLTFKKGALSDLEVYDVYTADGQLKGHVEPPWQVKKYLDQAAWYLRDSNWDPDFSVSAKRAQWFLNKSMGIDVDGVFSFDTSFVKDLISVIGHLNIPDYDKTIDAKIFYDVVQYEAEKEFFPGSRQKSNFLTALSRSLLLEIKGAKPNILMSFLPVFYMDLNEKHLQLFFNNEKIQERIGFLGWDGGANKDICFSDNCFGDFVFLVESNFGVNKANYFVSRSVSVRVKVEKDFIRREMEVTFENKAPLVLGDKGKYKNYFRIFLPSSVSVEKATIQEGNYYYDVSLDQGVVRDMKEVGFLIEIPAESVKKAVLVWKDEGTLDLSKNGEYRFVFRKQAGIDNVSFNLEVEFPPDFKPASDNLQLTSRGVFVYNQASLKTDFFTRFYW